MDYSRTSLGLDVKTVLNKLNPGVIANKKDLNGSITSNLAVKATIPLQGDVVRGMRAL